MSVVTAFEFHDVLALRAGAGKTDRRHRRFSPRVHETNLLYVRECRNHKFGEISFDRSGCAKAHALAGRGGYGVYHGWKCVAKNERPPRSDVVDVFIPVGVP